MRSRGARAGIATAGVAVAVVLFVVLAGADDSATDTGTTQRASAQARTEDQSPADSTTTQPQAQETTTAGEPPEPEPPPIPRIVVRDGQPVGGVARFEYESGQRVRFVVRSDGADEVHVHGFDIRKDVPANGSVRFEFRADIEGVFEVELETTHVQIAELRIEP
jgi:hypothetical protein